MFSLAVRYLIQRIIVFGLLLCAVIAIAAQPRVLLINGANFGGLDWAKTGLAIQRINPKAFPADAQALATQYNMVVLNTQSLSEAQLLVLEAFVRGGGGVWFDGISDRNTWSGSWADVVSPAIGCYTESREQVQVAMGEKTSPLADLALSSLPRIGSIVNAAIPSATPARMMNLSSAWYFSKPMWSDGWQVWLKSADPSGMPILSTARYGAGRTAIWSPNGFANPAEPTLLEVVRRVATWLAGESRPMSLSTVAVKGYEIPASYREPLANGMKGMGQKVGVDAFTLPPEALKEAGYLNVTDPATARTVLLMNNEANSTVKADQATVIMRLPAGSPESNKDFNIDALVKQSSVRQANLVGPDNIATPVKLAHRVPAYAGILPTINVPQGTPAVSIPTSWKMAFTNDTDSDVDLKQGWGAKTFDDSAWQTGQIAPLKTSLFGKEVGYDGAIWYRGLINVPTDAVTPNAALIIEVADNTLAGYVTAFVDGKEVALEPRIIVLPLATIGAGQHQLAIRVYGETRSNRGLKRVAATYLPLLWRPDGKHEGWAKGWFRADADVSPWLPVNNSFAGDPVGREAMEGWARYEVTVPANVAPFVAQFDFALNVQYIIFVNGKQVESNGAERAPRVQLPGNLFVPGKNTVVVWARFSDRQARSFNLKFLPNETIVYRADMQAQRDGESVRAVLGYDNVDFTYCPQDICLLVNNVVVGGSIGRDGSRVILFAPNALHAGGNTVEVRMRRSIDACGLESLECVDVPAGMRTIVPGWRMQRLTAGLDWFAPTLDDKQWPVADVTRSQMYDRSWVTQATPDLEREGYAYRTHLFFTAEDLKKNQTLYLRGAAIQEIIVNGTKIAPLNKWYYSLNQALHVGDNVIAFAPNRSVYQGLNMPVPDGREGHVQMPALCTDVAPLIPVDPRLAAYCINRLFPVSPLRNVPEGAHTLLAWPNGDPAVVATQLNGRWEVIAGPGIFTGVLPAPTMQTRALVNGSTSTPFYDYCYRLSEEGFIGDRTDQLIPALLGVLDRHPGFADAGVEDRTVRVTVHAPDQFTGIVAWRLYTWDGSLISSGDTPITVAANQQTPMTIPLPDLNDRLLPEGAGFGTFVRVRLEILSADRRQPLAFLDRHFIPTPPVTVSMLLDKKAESLNEQNGGLYPRIMHISSGQLNERYVYLPGETVTLTASLKNNGLRPQTVRVRITATPGLVGVPVVREQTLTIPSASTQPYSITLDKSLTAREQPWSVRAEVINGQQIVAQSVNSLVVATPRGEIHDVEEVTRDSRSFGGYMWFMTQHALTPEHRQGTDAQPVPDGKEWWMRVRANGDGNWTVAEGIHRGMGDGDQVGLLWGPFYDQYRGEIMDSYGWFPNGQNVREWWGNYATRELLRINGRRPQVMALSDWWQYDAGFPRQSYATLQMFNAFLVRNAGQQIAGKLLDGKPIKAATMKEMLDIIDRDYKSVFDYFVAAGLARSAEYTGELMNAVAPETTQLGQGGYSMRLSSVVGGVKLGPKWASQENQGILDADNHPFANDWQYALESMTFRGIGINNYLLTHWETPMGYHADRNTTWTFTQLGSAQWRRRLLDSRWQVIVDEQGKFQRVLNTTHDEEMMSEILADRSPANIASSPFPYHWWIKDRLANLSMTIAQAKPLSALLVVGENQLDWVKYYSLLGRFREAGISFAGSVNIAQLDKIDAKDIPALVWPAADGVDGDLLAAVERKIRAGVPVLLIGNVPKALGNGPDLRTALGVKEDTAVHSAGPQEVAAAYAQRPEARGLADTPRLRNLVDMRYTSVPNGMESIVTRAGRLVLGKMNNVVFYSLTPESWDQDDPAVRRLAVNLFDEMTGNPVNWSQETSGYAFTGLDGATYIVVENMSHTAHAATVRVNVKGITAQANAADMLSGEHLPLRSSGTGVEFTCNLDSADGTIVMISPIAK